MKLDPKLFLLAGSLALGALVVPLASAQVAQAETGSPSDIAYCRELGRIYVRYIGWDFIYGDHSRRRANNDAQVALTKCQQGDTSGIPVLERELLANKFTLPARG